MSVTVRLVPEFDPWMLVQLAAVFDDVAAINRVIGLVENYNGSAFITSPLCSFIRQFRDVFVEDSIRTIRGGDDERKQ
ncbi:hypothetical protein [Nocardia gipuzkoensis]